MYAARHGGDFKLLEKKFRLSQQRPNWKMRLHAFLWYAFKNRSLKGLRLLAMRLIAQKVDYIVTNKKESRAKIISQTHMSFLDFLEKSRKKSDASKVEISTYSKASIFVPPKKKEPYSV